MNPSSDSSNKRKRDESSSSPSSSPSAKICKIDSTIPTTTTTTTTTPILASKIQTRILNPQFVQIVVYASSHFFKKTLPMIYFLDVSITDTRAIDYLYEKTRLAFSEKLIAPKTQQFQCTFYFSSFRIIGLPNSLISTQDWTLENTEEDMFRKRNRFYDQIYLTLWLYGKIDLLMTGGGGGCETQSNDLFLNSKTFSELSSSLYTYWENQNTILPNLTCNLSRSYLSISTDSPSFNILKKATKTFELPVPYNVTAVINLFLN